MLVRYSRAAKNSFRFYSNNVKKIRNVGIIAHIDAGKTTLTERMLFYSGFLKDMGEVHTGDTVMDSMALEKERGITISSAAITFPWKGFQVNLIDTPGHVDFTMEVERSLRVLDGAIVLLDGSAGVEAQTMTVWRQAQRHNIPCIAFINKMDKANANLEMTKDSMWQKLGLEPLVVQIPIQDNVFKRLIDLINMEEIHYELGTKGAVMTRTPISETVYSHALQLRQELIEKISDYDDVIAELYLNDADIIKSDLESALQRIVKSSKALVTYAGSAYKNVGVQPVCDAITTFLPNPLEHNINLKPLDINKELCALAFKIAHHPTKGVLTYVRLYSGRIKEGDHVFNKRRKCTEKVSRVSNVYADEFKQVKEVGVGDIAVLGGLKETITGDTLVSSMKSELTLPGIEVPDPVFFCSIEPPSMSKQKSLELALKNLVREDPSLRLHADENTDQTILSGMGELHLEIILKRIHQVRRLKVKPIEVLLTQSVAGIQNRCRIGAIDGGLQRSTYQKREDCSEFRKRHCRKQVFSDH